MSRIKLGSASHLSLGVSVLAPHVNSLTWRIFKTLNSGSLINVTKEHQCLRGWHEGRSGIMIRMGTQLGDELSLGWLHISCVTFSTLLWGNGVREMKRGGGRRKEEKERGRGREREGREGGRSKERRKERKRKEGRDGGKEEERERREGKKKERKRKKARKKLRGKEGRKKGRSVSTVTQLGT